jgi:hypothetical protein
MSANHSTTMFSENYMKIKRLKYFIFKIPVHRKILYSLLSTTAGKVPSILQFKHHTSFLLHCIYTDFNHYYRFKTYFVNCSSNNKQCNISDNVDDDIKAHIATCGRYWRTQSALLKRQLVPTRPCGTTT